MSLLVRRILSPFISILIIMLGCSPGPQKIAIYYMGWDVSTYVPQTCDNLVLLGDPVEINDRIEIKKIMDCVKSEGLVKLQDSGEINARICCFFYDVKGNTLKTITFGPPSSLAINGSIYQWNSKLFDLILDYLPPEYRDRVF